MEIQKDMKTGILKKALFAAMLIMGFGAAILVPSSVVLAEGSHQLNAMQELDSDTVLYADILNAGETIHVSGCEDTSIEIYNTNGTLANDGDDTQVAITTHTANLTCRVALPNPVTGGYKFTPASIGTYRIIIGSSQETYDFSVTANNATNPNPTSTHGRIWSYRWYLNTNDDMSISGDDYPEDTSTNADLYSLVPAPLANEYFVWKLDLNKFAGGSYQLVANSTGLDAPYAGYSAPQSGTSNNVTPKYPIYLSYPDKATATNSTTPSITSFMFRDSAGEDNVFSPGSTVGVQDNGTFRFNSNVANATYAVTIDTNNDGVYGTGDRLLLGQASTGLNTVSWDGKYANGTTVLVGSYNAKLQLRIGEFHFVARDVEASGGTYDHVTWNNGLAIYRALGIGSSQSVRMFWDDVTELPRTSPGTSTRLTDPYPEASSNLPNGVMSGVTADSNADGKADGFHSWGDFDGLGMGNRDFIDTYTFGEDDISFTSLSVSATDTATDLDGISNSIETNAPNGGDGNGDSFSDHLQNDVTSLPNPITGGGKYNTVEVTGCTGLSNVSIVAESGLSAQDSTHEYPLGLFNFDVSCLAPGATANIKIFYDKTYDTSNWQARKFMNNTYGVVVGAVFGTATVGGTQVTTLSYSITDGGIGDEDGVVNGTIVDPTGPGLTTSAVASSATGTLANTGNEIIAPIVVATALILAALTVWLRPATPHKQEANS